MALNRIQNHLATLQMVAPGGGVVSGTPLLIGQLFGVPLETVAATLPFTLGAIGIYDLDKQAALAITAGADVYWDSGAGEADTTNTNHHIGKCMVAAAGADDTVRVAVGIPVGTSEGLGDFAALFGANTILKADTDDTPAALTMGEQTFLGRITGGVITALTPAQGRTLLDVPQTGSVMLATTYDAQTLLVAVADNTPVAQVVGDSEFVGRPAGGNLGVMTAVQARTVLNVENGADVTDEANVLAALAVGATAKAMGGGAITNVGLVDGRDVSADGTALDAAVASVAALGAENTDGHMCIPFSRALAEGGTWTASISGDGLPVLTRTAAATTDEAWIEVPVPARTAASRGIRPTGLIACYTIDTASPDDIRFELWKRTLGADGAAASAVVLFGNVDGDYDAAHDTAAERVDDTGAPELHTATLTDAAGSVYLGASEQLIVRIIVDGDAGAAAAVVVTGLELLFAETPNDLA